MGLFGIGKISKLKEQVTELKDLNAQILNTFQSNLLNQSRRLLNENIAHYPEWDMAQQSNRYVTSDDIYSIISLIANTSALVQMFHYYIRDEKALKAINYKDFNPISYSKSVKLQTKALEESGEDDKLHQLLESPHLTLSKTEFFKLLYTYLLRQGEVIIYKIRADFGVNEGLPIKLEFLESENVVRYKSGFPKRIIKYDYRENGITIMKDIPPEDVIHIQYPEGIGPLKALLKRLTRMDKEMDVTVAQLDNGGVPTIIFDKSDDGTAIDKDANGNDITIAGRRKESFYRFISNKANKGAPYFASGDMGAIPTGLKLTDMEVSALEKVDFKKACNAFHVSDRLFNNDATGSEVSDDNAQKGLYTTGCLPLVYMVRDSFNASLIPEFNQVRGVKQTIREDISEIPALQADMLKMAQAVSTLPCFVPNEVREMFHWELIDDPAANEMYIKTGYVKLEDLQGSQELPITEDYENQ